MTDFAIPSLDRVRAVSTRQGSAGTPKAAASTAFSDGTAFWLGAAFAGDAEACGGEPAGAG
ncbi:hypothetical protein GCM10010412_077690 [Nonomuraea recticatena]|uniref:Uncharacterized protein n=1 Tax=Nonomuraea recticatena TaxID=46178 RepID=A0ABN3SZS1_9ACTN